MSTSPTDECRSTCTCAGSHGAGDAAVPVTSSFGPNSRSVAMPSRMSRLGVLSSRRRISRAYSSLSVCALSAHTAGPCMHMGECWHISHHLEILACIKPQQFKLQPKAGTRWL